MEFSFSYLGNMAAVFMKQFENFINLCAKVAFTSTTFGSLATVHYENKLTKNIRPTDIL
jgi:phage-related protein